jgi:hypothetical protein
VRFYDFAVVLNPGAFPLPNSREVHLRYSAFIEAIVARLGSRKIEAPWSKFVLELTRQDAPGSFYAALPKVGLRVASVITALPDEALLTAKGEAVRPVLAKAVASTREVVRDGSGWDNEEFWESVERVGTHRGRYEHRALPVMDRKSKVVYHLTYEWDERGTTVYADRRRSIEDAAFLARTVVAAFPDRWPATLAWLGGFAPRKMRLTSNQLEIFDGRGALLAAPPRPD